MAVDYVTLGCKLPCGLLLDVPGKPRVAVKGANTSRLIGGYGITEAVPKDAFEEFVRTHPDFPPIKSGALFVVPKAVDAEKEARSREGVKTGFEGADQIGAGGVAALT